MSSTYHVLAASDLVQDWSNGGAISANDDWSAVPSIVGYLGDINSSSPTNVDPRTLTGANLGAVDVIPNQTAPNSVTNGGVAEFAIANPTIALNGSGTADAPSLVLYLDASGRDNVRVSFNARDLDASGDDASQPIAVQYRLGSSGVWTNVTGGYAADVTTANAATQVTPFDLLLPEEVNGRADLQVRILTTNAGGNDEWVGIDDIRVTSTDINPVPGQTVGFSANSVSVSQDEGNGGTTTYQFTVERSGGTEGDIAFSGAIASAQTNAADFVGGKPVSFSGTIAAGQTSAIVTVTVAGDVVSEPNETFTLTLQNASNSESVTTTIGTAQATGIIVNDDVAITKISAIQGTGSSSGMLGQTVTVDAIVVGDFQNGDGDNGRNLNGFYLQEEITDSDGNVFTSEAIFVFGGSGDVQVGDRVRVTGSISEYFGLTQLTASSISVVQAGAVSDINTMATAIDLPGLGTTLSQDGDYQPDLEAYEGMLVTIPETLVITEQFNLDRFNEIKLVAGERPAQFTQENAPDAAAYQAHLAELGARTITYDDGLNTQNEAISNLDGFGPTYNTDTAPRMGDTITGLTGVLDYQWAGNSASGATWRVRSVEDGTNTFVDSATPRTDAPADVGGSLKVASFNVLNFFTTLDIGSATTAIGEDPRGADNASELARQTAKLVNSILAMDVDVLALTELENDFAPNSSGNAIQYLVAQLNAEAGAGTYAWVNPGQQFVGGDAIAVGFIYRTADVRIADGTTVEILNDADLPGLGLSGLLGQSTVGHVFDGENTSRNALAVTFEQISTGETFTAIANHLKSKSGTGTGADADQGDGQGNWQNQRELATVALTAWAQSDPTGSGDSDVLLLGDFNGYAKEQSIALLEAGGYENLQTREEDAYSYVFDGQTGTLDYAFANDSMSSQVTGVTTWHTNADEADALDYNNDFGRDPAIFDPESTVRVSDHDPVIIGLDLGEQTSPVYTLQILHASDFEAGLNAVGRAGNFAAIVDYLEETYANSITLSSGDNYIPSPFFSAGSDASLKEVYETALESYYGLATGTLNISPGFGTADISMLNIIGVQASAIGNHEFDAGTNPFAAIIRQTAGYPGAQFPYLSANLDFSGDPNLSGLYTSTIQDADNYTGFPPVAGIGKKIAPATIIEENGERIGVVGATTQIVESISSTGGVDVIGDDIDDMVALAAILQPTIDALIAQGINKIILVSHLQQLAFEQALAPLLHGVDIIIAGGSHTLLADGTDTLRPGDTADGTYPIVTQNADGNTTLIVNTDSEYSYVGRLVVDFDANGNVIAGSVDPNVSGAYASTDEVVDDLYDDVIDVDADGDIDADDADPFADGSRGDLVNDIAQAVGDVIELQDGNIFGSTSVYLEGRRGEVRTEETNLGSLTADANLWYAQQVDATVLVSIKNGGGIRDSIGNVYAVGGVAEENPPLANPDVGKEEGDISQLDIANSLRFNNSLSLVTVTAAQLLEVLEHAVKATTATATPGQFAQIGGIAYSFDIDYPAGNRVQSAALIDENGNPILALVQNGELVVDPDMAIRMVTLSFLLTGGDSYPFAAFIAANPTFANVVNLTPSLVPDAGQVANFAAEGTEQDAFAEYLAANYSDAAYDVLDTDRAHDTRIQNLDYRADTVLSAVPIVLVGDDGDNVLDGALGNDTLSGLDGDDMLSGFGGDDTLDGGEGDDMLLGGEGNDTLMGGEGDDELQGEAGNDVLNGGDGDDTLAGGEGDDVLIGGEGYDLLEGGDGNDRLVAGFGDSAYGNDGDDVIEVSTEDYAPSLIDGGEGNDTLKLVGPGTGVIDPSNIVISVENLLVHEGSWSVTDTVAYDAITIAGDATLTSGVTLNEDDRLTIQAGGELIAGTAITWQGGGGVVIDNAGLIEGSSRVLTTTTGATGSLIFNNEAGGTVRGAVTPQQAGQADATITVNNAGVMEAGGRVLDFRSFDGSGASAVINNLAGGIIRQYGNDTDVIRPGNDGTVNNWGTIITDASFAGGGDLIDFQSDTGGKVNNYAGGWMEASRHAVTGDNAVTVVNSGTMIGRNGSAVNLDTDGSMAQKAFITNHGTMEGRSAELADSDGDAIDVDGLVQVLNYGRIAGLGAEGYHDGEPNVSEAIAVGGGEIVNSATGEIYGYGRAIQVDNSSNSNALGVSTIVNDGLIEGGGHGPEGVSAEDAARFDLRGNEAINLVGDYEDFVGNNATGRIIGGVSMGGARDTLNNSGSIVATGGSAIDMGAGNDQVNLYVGATVTGTILLGSGDDVALSTSAGGFTIDGGDGNDTMAMDYAYGGNDLLIGGAGDDAIYAGFGNDQIDGGLDNDTLFGNDGDDRITGGGGNDTVNGGAGTDTAMFVGNVDQYGYTLNLDGSVSVVDQRSASPDGTDTLTDIERLGLGDGERDLVLGTSGADSIAAAAANAIVLAGAGDDVVSATTAPDLIDGGDGTDMIDYSQAGSAMTINLAAGQASSAGSADVQQIRNLENATGTGFDDVLTGTSGANTLIGGNGNDVLNGGDGDDILRGGAGNDTINGGAGYDLLDLSDATGAVSINMAAGTLTGAGIGTDTFSGIEGFLFGNGNDQVIGGNGDDVFDGGAGNDTIAGGAGDDNLNGGDGNDSVDGGSGDDVVAGGIGNDTLKGGSGDDAISGGEGNDSIDAGSGDDVIVAGAGTDTVNGGSGNDVIDGGIGNDILTGGSGSDVFVFAAGFGRDTITDFAASGSSKDFIQFSSDVFADYAAVMSHASQVGNSIVVTLDPDHALTLANTSMASLTADDFRFV